MGTDMKQKQLEILLNDFELLAKTTLLQFNITKNLLTNNKTEALYEEAESNEIIIDRLEVKIREEVIFCIFQFNPKARTLRKVITYQDLTTNLERIGDMLLNIIHFSRDTDFSIPKLDPIYASIHKMLTYTHEMLRNAISSFSNEESQVAYAVIEEDDKVDQLFYDIRILLTNTFDQTEVSKEDIQKIISLSSISQNLERIGDSATNIAEATIFLTEGKDIRHGNSK